MKRYALVVQYDGGNYAGFQVQPNGPTIQAALENALTVLARETVAVVGAGRTDAGVHAQGQVVHFDAALSVPKNRLVPAVNTLLPRDIRVTAAEQVAADFHARYDAVEKTYCYRIWQGSYADVFWRPYSCWQRHPCSWAEVRAAGATLLGTHNFRAFAAAGGGVKTFTRTLKAFSVCEEGPLVQLYFTADGFLYNMVRNMVGTLLMVARGRREPGWVTTVLQGQDRQAAGPTAPPEGLVLVEVKYS